MKTIKCTIRGAMRSVTIWVNGACLAIFPFADSLAAGIAANLPALADYMPDDAHKALSGALIVFNIVQRARTTQSLAAKGSP